MTDRYRAVPNRPSIIDHLSTHWPRALPAIQQFEAQGASPQGGPGWSAIDLLLGTTRYRSGYKMRTNSAVPLVSIRIFPTTIQSNCIYRPIPSGTQSPIGSRPPEHALAAGPARQIPICCRMERLHGSWGLWQFDGIVFDNFLPRKAGSAILRPLVFGFFVHIFFNFLMHFSSFCAMIDSCEAM